MGLVLRFLGAARTTTGSMTLLESGTERHLVDCGLVQGGGEEDRINRAPFPVEPERIDSVLITHAHLDHVGLVPRLVREGFRGAIHATAATQDLTRVTLLDAAHVLEREHHHALRHGGHPPEPLYTSDDVEACLRRIHPHPYRTPFPLGGGLTARLLDAGHILGSAVVEISAPGEGGASPRALLTGDLGNRGKPILRDPDPPPACDAIVIEATYGDRLHRSFSETVRELEGILQETHAKGGNLVVPAFAVERTQEILYVLAGLARAGRFPPFRTFLDSPMAIEATEVFQRHYEALDPEALALVRSGRGLFDLPGFETTLTPAASKHLNHIARGAILIAGSGMCEAGRVRHHLSRNLPRPESTVLITGFQAQGTLGRALVDGASEVRLLGEVVPVRARIATLGGFSAHADRDGLLRWLRSVPAPAHPRVRVVHGEAGVVRTFAERVRREIGWEARAPAPGETLEI